MIHQPKLAYAAGTTWLLFRLGSLPFGRRAVMLSLTLLDSEA
jgi:hypothetical protein